MTASITHFLDRATGPVRFRADLRRKTQAVRMYRTTFEPLGGVSTTIPRDVLGGDLLDLFSSRLQALIKAGELTTAPGSSPAARTGFALRRPPIGGEREPFLPPARAGETAGGRFGPPGAATSRRERSFSAADWPDDANDSGASGSTLSSTRSRALPGVEWLPPAPRPALTAGEVRASGSSQRDLAAGAVFARKIEEYCRLATEAVQPEQTRDRPILRDGNAGQSIWGFPNLPDSALGARTWPELTGRELAERIQAFTSGAAFPPPTPQPHPAAPSGSREPVAIENIFHIAVNSDGDSLNELSDKIADMLREQAIHHGIDIT